MRKKNQNRQRLCDYIEVDSSFYMFSLSLSLSPFCLLFVYFSVVFLYCWHSIHKVFARRHSSLQVAVDRGLTKTAAFEPARTLTDPSMNNNVVILFDGPSFDRHDRVACTHWHTSHTHICVLHSHTNIRHFTVYIFMIATLPERIL